MAVTFALGITAPEGSETVPNILPKPCARTVTERASRHRTIKPNSVQLLMAQFSLSVARLLAGGLGLVGVRLPLARCETIPLWLWRRRQPVRIRFAALTNMPSAFYAPLIVRSSVIMTADDGKCDSLV